MYAILWKTNALNKYKLLDMWLLYVGLILIQEEKNG
jgi:hypothetical protein